MNIQDKPPGLHKIGPNPWDYEFNPAVGQRITYVGLDGDTFTGTVADVDEDDDTGEITMTLGEK